MKTPSPPAISPTTTDSGVSVLAALAAIPLLEPLCDEERATLAAHARLCSFSRGQSIFDAGEKAQGFHILLDGLVKIYHITRDGKEMVLHLIRPGATFGEAPVFKGGVWPASAAAVQASRTLFIPGAVFVALIRANPDLALRMLGTLSQRLYMFTRKLEAQTIREAPQRLAAYLLHRSRLAGNADRVTLETAREVLANMLGTARETLSRALTRLTDAGVIEVRGREVLLRDAALLQKIAEGQISCDDL